MNLKNKKVLITGADGFIGSHLTEMIVTKVSGVRALSCYNSFNNWGWLDDLSCIKDIEVVTGDVRDPYFCLEMTKNIDVVFHLAALIAIPYSYIAPDSYVETNIKGTLHVCQAVLKNECQKLVHVSTSEVYGTACYVPIDENHPLQPQSPYSASKIGADSMAMSHYNAFSMPVTIARPFNTYGPRQSARAIIPTIITQIAGGAKELQLGNLSPTRDLNYVEDTCRGLIALAESDKAVGETVNIGSNFEISMGDLVNSIKEIMDSDIAVKTDDQRLRPETSEVYRLWCENKKIFGLTGFVPKFTLKEGLQNTVAWFSHPDNLNKYKPDTYNV